MAREAGSSDPFPASGGTAEVADRRQVGRLAAALAALALGLVFVVQNSERVELRFLFLEVTARVWVGLIVALLLGAVLGQAVEALWNRRRRGRDRSTP